MIDAAFERRGASFRTQSDTSDMPRHCVILDVTLGVRSGDGDGDAKSV